MTRQCASGALGQRQARLQATLDALPDPMFESLGLQRVADPADQLDGSLTIGPAPVARFSLRFRPAGPPPGADPAWRPAGISAPNGPIMRAPIA